MLQVFWHGQNLVQSIVFQLYNLPTLQRRVSAIAELLADLGLCLMFDHVRVINFLLLLLIIIIMKEMTFRIACSHQNTHCNSFETLIVIKNYIRATPLILARKVCRGPS